MQTRVFKSLIRVKERAVMSTASLATCTPHKHSSCITQRKFHCQQSDYHHLKMDSYTKSTVQVTGPTLSLKQSVSKCFLPLLLHNPPSHFYQCCFKRNKRDNHQTCNFPANLKSTFGYSEFN